MTKPGKHEKDSVREQGASLVEYALLVGLIAVVAIAAMREIGYSVWEQNFLVSCQLRCKANTYVMPGGLCEQWAKTKCRRDGLCKASDINYLLNGQCPIS